MSPITVQLFEHQLAQEKKARSFWNGKIFSNVAENVYREAKARLISERDSMCASDAGFEVLDAWFEYRRYAGDAEDDMRKVDVASGASERGKHADGVEKPGWWKGACSDGVEKSMAAKSTIVASTTDVHHRNLTRS